MTASSTTGGRAETALAATRPSPARRIGRSAGWLLAAAAIAFGSAGVVTGVGGTPGGGSRPELTAAGDAAIRPGLAAARTALVRLRDDVDALGGIGRGALAAVIGSDQAALASAIAKGTAMTDRIAAETDALRAELRALPGVDGAASLPLPPDVAIRIGPDLRHRYELLLSSLDATDGLGGAWTALTDGSLAARQLAGLLAAHDQSTAQAARDGGGGRWAAALRQLDTSDQAIAAARSMRDTLANTVDVSTLDSWLNLNADYDHALRILYAALVKSKGKLNQAIKDDFAATQAAYARLPADTRGLVVIMGDLSRGGLNQAVITIEIAKGRLDDALDAVTASELGVDQGAGASGSPSASP